ncbi:PIN domain-containing protein [Bifidobacterium myosotis]|uniref:PIN domain-containing protein n=1 Tax=Bifidobacterium myosotis TaxID=1630166 RepID=A0A5M9ZHE1_9BIFI|nr:PIN domain-containing protein [Bifidobacterium myosotis]KAA8826980.1 PIN domain-containing protein [Bifidobacterium myosotis]
MAGRTDAFLDTNVLFGSPSFDMLLTLGMREYGLYHPLWSEYVFDELGEHVPDRIARTLGGRNDGGAIWAETAARARRLTAHRLAAMRRAFPDSMVDVPPEVVAEYPDSLTGDPDDKPIAVGAIVGRADVLVTNNRKDFDIDRIAEYRPMRLMDASGFMNLLMREDRTAFYGALGDMLSSHKRHPTNLRELVKDLESNPDLRRIGHLIEEDVAMRYERARLAVFGRTATHRRGVQERDRLGRFGHVVGGCDSADDIEPPYPAPTGEMWGPDGNGPALA